MSGLSILTAVAVVALSQSPDPGEVQNPAPKLTAVNDGELRLRSLKQYTFGGENAEAYWSNSGRSLILQAKLHDWGCDRIMRLDVATGAMTEVSSGAGATTCSFYLPGDEEIIYASTHKAGPACPPKPDMSKGYVWALYDSYDIYRSPARGAGQSGEGLRALTEQQGYDAEATVCSVDGSIVFTSTRDGDLELYRMDRDGKNVKRLTHTPGYDGGAFFNRDCSKLVWRASRPKPGKELDEYKALLAQGLVRPSKLELFVAKADGSEQTQITYLNAASFGPYWHPTKDRILFSTNYADPKGRDFDIFAVDSTGANLERITTTPGFDGFPMFSPDGQYLAFSSNRATEPGKNDTNVFIAKWHEEGSGERISTASTRVMMEVEYLAKPDLQGRGIGTPGLEEAARYLERRFDAMGLTPAGADGGYRQRISVVTDLQAAEDTSVKLGEVTLAATAFVPLGFSAEGEVSGAAVFVGYGIKAAELEYDSYAGLNVKGKIAVARRFTPEAAPFTKEEDKRRYGDLRHKAWTAREAGATALVIVDWPETATGTELPVEARLPLLKPDGEQDARIPVVAIKRAGLEAVLGPLAAKKPLQAKIRVAFERTSSDAYNIIAKLPASAPPARKLPGAVVVGAHYDHLGLGGHGSLAPGVRAAHLGADDNASGIAGMMEAARTLMEPNLKLRRDVYFVAFAGEELGVLGSSEFTRKPPKGVVMKDVLAMLNLDMVGRLRENRLQVLGVESGEQWKKLLTPACEKARVECLGSGGGYGPSDHTPFYAAKVPVLHFFTGAHGDYHKPSDVAARVNGAGVAQVALIVADLVGSVSQAEKRITYRNVPTPAPAGDMRSFNASLGTIPDYAPPAGTKGMLIAGVRPGGAAELAGIKGGDVLLKLGRHTVGSVQDLMFLLNSSKPGETLTAIVLREGQELRLSVTLQESKRH